MTPAHWMEVVFNLTYLIVIFGLVIAMSARLTEDGLQHRLRNGFLLLAVGDTGHVGFRVVALLRGGLDSRLDVLGVPVPLVVGSYAFYLPVILFVQRAPLVGMLMIPKTLMYVAMAWLAWARLFKPADVRPPRAATVP